MLSIDFTSFCTDHATVIKIFVLPVARWGKEAKFLMLGGRDDDKKMGSGALGVDAGAVWGHQLFICRRDGHRRVVGVRLEDVGGGFSGSLGFFKCTRISAHQWIAAVLAFGAAGDFLLAEFGLVVGGTTFAIGHIIAIRSYWFNRRPEWTPSQRWLIYSVTPLALIIAWQLARQSEPGLLGAALAYTFIVAMMSAAAWASRFPRYRTGLGAMLFLLSDLFIFAGAGGTMDQSVSALFVWPLYFAGQALIAWGVVSTLSNEAIRSPKQMQV